MNINFEYKDVSASERLENMVAERLTKLEDKYDFIVTCDVYLKKETTSSPQTGLICEIRVNIPGTTLFAGSNSGSLEASIAKATSDVKSQLQRKKEKMQMH